MTIAAQTVINGLSPGHHALRYVKVIDVVTRALGGRAMSVWFN